MVELTERVELINEGGVEVEIIQGDFPGFYLALIFEPSDGRPDYITEWDRVTNDPKRGSWTDHADAFTLRSARKKARKLIARYREQNPQTYARLSEAKALVDALAKAEAEATAIVAGTVVATEPRSRVSGLAEH